MTTGTVQSFDGVPIAYSATGTGPTALVFVHGWCGEQGHWREQVGAFSADHVVVTLDMAGHGMSGRDRTDWTTEAFAQDVAAVVDHLRLDRAVLIGHSQGGTVVTEAAAQLGDRVIALIGADAWASLQPHAGSAEDQAQRLAALHSDFAGYVDLWMRRMFAPGANPALVDEIAAGMARCDPDVAIPAMIGSSRYTAKLQQRMRELPVPSHNIAAGGSLFPKDPAVAADYGMGFELMDGVGHFLMLEAPEAFNRRLRGALRVMLPTPTRPGA